MTADSAIAPTACEVAETSNQYVTCFSFSIHGSVPMMEQGHGTGALCAQIKCYTRAEDKSQVKRPPGHSL